MKILSPVACLFALGIVACGSDVVGGGGGAGGAGTGGSDTTSSGGAPSATTTTTATTASGEGGQGQGGGGLGVCTPGAGTSATTGGTIECSSDFSCEGGDVSIECSAAEGGGEASCDCFGGDGLLVGSCISPDFGMECIFPDSCCFDVFAGGGGGGSGISGCEYESGTGSVGAGAPSECISTYQCDQGQVDISCAESPTGATCTCTSPSRTVECEEAGFACADLEGSCCAALL